MATSDAFIDAALRSIWPIDDPYEHDPVLFVRDVLGGHPWSKQRDILQAVHDHSRVAVRSCHGAGKTKTAAWVVLWFLATHKNSRVITTAPTWAQVAQLLWRSIRSDVDTAHERGKLMHVPTPNQTSLELDTQWFAIGASTDKPERFQGHHADHLLLVVDEASGVDEAIYEAAEGFLTAEGAKVLLIGNPTRVSGQFYRAFGEHRDTWHTIAISALDTPNLTGEQVPANVARSLPRADWPAEKRREWGEQSPVYAIRVLGEFSRTVDRNVMALGDVEDAQDTERHAAIPGPDKSQDRHIVTVDVARFGDDETVIALRSGRVGAEQSRVRIVASYRGKDTVETAQRVLAVASTLPTETTSIVVDDPGVGGGVTDQLRAAGTYNVHAFNGGAKARIPGKYPNRRSELWFATAEHLEHVALDPDDQLTADLTAPEFRIDEKLRRVVEAKDRTKQRLGRSPDRADAVCLCFAIALDDAGSARSGKQRWTTRAPEAITAGLMDREF